MAEVTRSYLAALAKHDWRAVCNTRAPEERDELARTAGSCERAFELVIKNRPGADRIFADAEIGEVRVKGDLAGADLIQAGQQQPATTFGAVQRNGTWFLKDLPDDKIP